jgi:hypothetical protein
MQYQVNQNCCNSGLPASTSYCGCGNQYPIVPGQNPALQTWNGQNFVVADGSYLEPIYLPYLQVQQDGASYVVGSDPNGKLGYYAPTFANKVSNLAGGAAGSVPYQIATNTTGFIPVGSVGQILQANALAAPSWVNQSSIIAGDATKLNGASVPTTKTIVGTNGSGQIVDASSATLSNNTTGNADTATTATNIYDGAAGSLPYQTASSTTTTLAIGSANQLLTVNSGATAPVWQTGIKGVTDGSSAASGFVGEWVYSNIPSASAVTLTTTGTVYQITSISLTAGDWNVSASVNIHLSSTTMTTGRGGISTANNALTVPSTSTTNVASNSYDTFASLISTSNASSQSTTLGLGGDLLLSTKTSRVNLSGTVTLYLVATAAFTGTAPTAYGTIEARRMR